MQYFIKRYEIYETRHKSKYVGPINGTGVLVDILFYFYFNEPLQDGSTHEPLITQELWDIVQEVRQHKKRTPKHMDEPNLFSGLVYCADCGKPLVLHRAHTMKATQNNFKCYTYGKRGKTECSPHHIREQDLITIVLDDLRRVTHFARQKEKLFAEYINQKNSVELRREINTVQKKLDAMRGETRN